MYARPNRTGTVKVMHGQIMLPCMPICCSNQSALVSQSMCTTSALSATLCSVTTVGAWLITTIGVHLSLKACAQSTKSALSVTLCSVATVGAWLINHEGPHGRCATLEKPVRVMYAKSVLVPHGRCMDTARLFYGQYINVQQLLWHP